MVRFTKFLLIPLLITAQIRSIENKDIAIGAAKAVGVAALFYGAYYTANLTSIVAHEAGHATAGKILYNDPIKLVFGWGSSGVFNQVEDVLFKNKYITVDKSFFKDYAGFSCGKPLDGENRNRMKNILIDVAGPLAGTAFGALITKYAPYPYNIIGAPIIIENLTQLIPINLDNQSFSDGRDIIKQIFYPNRKIYRKFDIHRSKAEKILKAKDICNGGIVCAGMGLAMARSLGYY
ncbi:MAG: hypothetical protein WC707_03870 [Candidatus Babeliaceae bacterium]|jgi:hypothetical protein